MEMPVAEELMIVVVLLSTFMHLFMYLHYVPLGIKHKHTCIHMRMFSFIMIVIYLF